MLTCWPSARRASRAAPATTATSSRPAPGLSYALTERLDLGVRYRWRHEREDDGNATSNAAFVTLAYRFPEYRTSW